MLPLRHMLSSLRHMLPSLWHMLSSLRHMLSSLRHMLSSLRHMLTPLRHMLSSLRHMLPSLRHSRPVFCPEKQPLNDPLKGSRCSGFHAICRFLIIAHSRNFRNAGHGRRPTGGSRMTRCDGSIPSHPANRNRELRANRQIVIKLSKKKS